MKTAKRYVVPVLQLAFLLVLTGPAFAQEPKQVGGDPIKTGTYKGQEIQYVAGEIAVKLETTATPVEVGAFLRQLNLRVVDEFDKLGWGLVEIPEKTDIFSVIPTLEASPLIAVAEPNVLIREAREPDDSRFYPRQWALKNTSQNPPNSTSDADIDAPQAWNLRTGSSDVIIAILDSGIPMKQDGDGDWDEDDLSHAEFNRGRKIILGPDYIDPNQYQGVRDRRGHGTHVAGIAVAETNNGKGIAGVCWGCKLLVVQVTDRNGYGTVASLHNGVIYAVDYAESHNRELVINLSVGGAASQQVEDAVAYAQNHGVLIVAAAGNDFGGPVLYPAAYSDQYANVVAVSATDHNDNQASYSNEGPELNVAAPGGYGGAFDANDIYSTTPNYSFTLESKGVSRSYGYMAGTSMAAPHVAGTAALMLSAAPWLGPAQLRDFLEQTAEDRGPGGFDERFGHGRINAYEAVYRAEVPGDPSDFDITNRGDYGDYVRMAWDASPSPDVVNYYIYRCLEDAGQRTCTSGYHYVTSSDVTK